MSETKKVLIVEDSTGARLQLQKTIDGLPGFSVVGLATNGAEGIKKLRELSPDIVCLDIVMPVMDGLEAVRVIRKFDKRVRIVMITSVGMAADQSLAALEAGADRVVAKPCDTARIKAALTGEPEQD